MSADRDYGESAQKDARRDALRSLPSIDELLSMPVAVEAVRAFARPLVVKALRKAVDEVRSALLAGERLPAVDIESDAGRAFWEGRVRRAIEEAERRTLGPVINGTGVVLHTNLGRAPLGPSALEAVAEVAGGYSNLEYDVEQGVRGSRHIHGEELLVELTGAEAAMVVNNNAAAVLLVLSAVAAGREVVLSRGEMIEIGGSFRIPDVLRQSGCRLVEVGTTNRTRLKDYEAAIGPETAALLKVHTSNYKVIGFTESVSGRQLASLARDRGVLAIEDLGSGVLVPTERYGLSHEPTVQEAVASGVDLVTFSGDKLMGGPQAGFIVGRRDLVERCRRHPLARALRTDKMTLAALFATLLEYARGNPEAVPIWRMLALKPGQIRARAKEIKRALLDRLREAGIEGAVIDEAVSVREARSAVGGGALPGDTLPTWVLSVALPGVPPQRLGDALRKGAPPIVGRIEEDAFLLDLRTVASEDDARVVERTAAAIQGLLAGRASGRVE